MGFIIASKFRKAISAGDTDALACLVEKHPNIDINTYSVNMDGMTPLLFAIKHGHEKSALALLQLGADPNARQSHGWTPMHQAAFCGRIGVVAGMLKCGGDPNLRNSNEQTVQALAKLTSRSDVVKLLEPYMRDPVLLFQDNLPEPLRTPVAGQPVADSWSLMSEDTIGHVFVKGDMGYQMTEIFNFAVQERIRILRNLDSQQEHVETQSFDSLPDTALRKAFAVLLEKGGNADDAVLKRSGTQLDKPRARTQKNAG